MILQTVKPKARPGRGCFGIMWTVRFPDHRDDSVVGLDLAEAVAFAYEARLERLTYRKEP
jgi:hypothetical protein